MLFRFPLFASLAFRVLSLCAVVKVRTAIPEDDIVFQDLQDSQYLYSAGLAPAVRLHPADAGLILILLLDALHQESTSGYEIRQDLMSP